MAVDLQYFRGGPRHNHLCTATELLKDRTVAAWIRLYKWTPEVLVGSETGRTAAVWVFQDPVQVEK